MKFTQRAFRLTQLSLVCMLSMSIFGSGKKAAPEEYAIKVLTGNEINTVKEFIARERIEVFREYPYLYEGDMEFGLKDVEDFALVSQSAVVVAYFNNEPVGYVTGIPLVDYIKNHMEGSADIFTQHTIDTHDHYYLADVIILPEHRGKSLTNCLFEQLEDYARAHGFRYVSFICEAYEQHPLKPLDYKELSPIWQHLGYAKTDIILRGSWSTIQASGAVRMQEHEFPYWIKKLQD